MALVNYITFSTVTVCLVTTVICNNEMGPGLWKINNILDCSDSYSMSEAITIEQVKENRTHDAFNCIFDLEYDVGPRYGMLADIWRLCDGGYKYHQSFEDDNICEFVEQNSKNNMDQAMELAGLESKCPIPKGHHEVTRFIVDYNKLPEKCFYGEYRVYFYIIENPEKDEGGDDMEKDKKEGEKVFCKVFDLEFEEILPGDPDM